MAGIQIQLHVTAFDKCGFENNYVVPNCLSKMHNQRRNAQFHISSFMPRFIITSKRDNLMCTYLCMCNVCTTRNLFTFVDVYIITHFLTFFAIQIYPAQMFGVEGIPSCQFFSFSTCK